MSLWRCLGVVIRSVANRVYKLAERKLFRLPLDAFALVDRLLSNVSSTTDNLQQHFLI